MENAPNPELEAARKQLEREANGWKHNVETYASENALTAYESLFTALVTTVPETLQDVAKGALHNIANQLQAVLSPTSNLAKAVSSAQLMLSGNQPTGGGFFAEVALLDRKINELADAFAQLAKQTKPRQGSALPTLSSQTRNELRDAQATVTNRVIPELKKAAQLSSAIIKQIYTKAGRIDTSSTYITQSAQLALALAGFWRNVCEQLSQEAENILKQAADDAAEDQEAEPLLPLEESVATWYENIRQKKIGLPKT